MTGGPTPETICEAEPTSAQLKPAALNERLLDAILSISRSATLDEALEPLLDAAIDVTRTTGGGIYCVEGETLVLRHHRGMPEAFIREVTYMPATLPPVPTLRQEQGPLEVTHVSPAMQELFEKNGVRHVFSYPLRARGTFFGVLNVASTQVDPPESADLQGLRFLVHEMELLFGRLCAEKALEESEQRCKILWNAALDGFALREWITPPEKGRFIDVNESACRMLGYTHDELLKLSPFDLVADDQREKLPGPYAKMQESGETSFEFTAITKDGRRILFEVNARLVTLGDRRLSFTVFRDMTEHRRMEAQLQQARDRLEEQVQARTAELIDTVDRLQAAMKELEHRTGQLQKCTLDLSQAEDRERKRLADLLHGDLQQTLAAAQARVGTLASQIGGNPEATHTLEQTRQLLDEAMEKSRTLSQELGPPVQCSGSLVTTFAWLAGYMERKHGLTVHTEVLGEVRSESEAVRSFLYRTAEQVLLNVAKHAQVQDASLRLQRVNNEVWLIISDWGQGFDVGSLAQTAGGALLAIRERAEALGGRTRVQSTPGKGTVFFVAIPDVNAGRESPA